MCAAALKAELVDADHLAVGAREHLDVERDYGDLR